MKPPRVRHRTMVLVLAVVVAPPSDSSDFGHVRQPNRLGRTLALGVLAVAVFNTLASLSLPVNERRPRVALVVVWLVLLLAHATIYWFGAPLRQRFGLVACVATQAAIVVAIGLSGALFPVGVALYIALSAETVILAGDRWGTVPITLGALLVFAANAMAVADLYRGATAGLLLAVTGVVAHAVAGLLQRQRLAKQPSGEAPVTESRGSAKLTPRELEVLQAIVRGARSHQIATDLTISERTVKAHLASIYQKLGVESRAAAVAVAIQRGLTEG